MIDSLTNVASKAIDRAAIAEDSSQHYKIQAVTWFNEAQKTPKQN